MSLDAKTLGIIRAPDDAAPTFYVELRSGAIATIDEPLGEGLANGDVVLIAADGLEWASPSLWSPTPTVAVVRRKLPSGAVLSTGGRLVYVPDHGTCAYEEGNTVLAHEITGVTDVIDKQSLLDDGPTPVPGNEPLRGTERFKDFGGLPSVVEQVKTFLDGVFDGDGLAGDGVVPPRGALFTGPPGTGKTKLARIAATEAGASYFTISGPEIHSKWVGESERTIRELFVAAGREPSALILIDEIDSALGRRGREAHEETNRVVAEVLTRMDGLQETGRIAVIGTTNRAGDLDPALRRPGRFGVEIKFPLPDHDDRSAILRTTAPPMARDRLPVDLVADRTGGWSAAELTDVWTHSATRTRGRGRSVISIDDLLSGLKLATEMRTRRSETEAAP